ncbi:MAG: carboxypeptidase regulatory-like domain-containing protein [Candidatus Krumholzibacteriia bacterium]
MPRWLRPLLALLAVAALIGVGRAASPHSLPGMQTPAPTGRVVVQYTEQATPADRARVAALAGTTPRPRLAPEVLQRAAAKRAGSWPSLAGLARYVDFEPGVADLAALRRVVSALAQDPAVASAFLEPRAVPAALGFDAFTGAGPVAGGRVDKALPTDDLTEWQGYMWDAPQGIGAWTVQAEPGARGGTVRIIDVEGAWLWSHEDLPTPFATLGVPIDDLGWRNHGTAVMGEMVSVDNAYGMTGIVPDAQAGNSSIGNQSVAGALLAAAAELEPGDLVLIELHAPGPNANGSGQYGYVPMEFWPDNFDAIRALTDLGIIVIEAAGNGQQDLDLPIYQGFFDREVRDSGAIMVGATAGSALDPAWFTNSGSRVDLSGWGLNVATCGYGDLQSGDETAWYTVQFSGTSSASPIVTGAVASLQGMAEASLGTTLDANLAREILRQTGTPIGGAQLIGPRPDLVAARASMLASGVGGLAGTVTEAGSGAPLAGIAVRIGTDGPRTTTAADGSYRIGLLPGTYTVNLDSYFHEPAGDQVTVAAGDDTAHDVVLDLRPSEVIDGQVTARADGAALVGVTLELLAEPVPATVSTTGGTFAFSPVPSGNEHLLQAGGLPGYGGVMLQFPWTDLPGKSTVSLRLPTVTYDFETGDDGWTAAGGLWQRGDPSLVGMGPGAAFDGSQCWGVGLDGAGYPDAASDELLSPLLQGSDYAGTVLQLSLHYWSGTEANYDGVNVVLNPGPDEVVLAPFGGYTDPVLGGLGYRGGWSGESGGWRTAVFDLTPQLAEADWRLAIRFGSDESVTAAGFLVDGVTLDAFSIPTGVDPAAPPPLLAGLDAYPNPFNPQVTLEWSLPRAGTLDLAVYDLRGRLVSRLLRGEAVAAAGRTTWNGTDAGGRAVASGVYLVQMRSESGGVSQRRITLAR